MAQIRCNVISAVAKALLLLYLYYLVLLREREERRERERERLQAKGREEEEEAFFTLPTSIQGRGYVQEPRSNKAIPPSPPPPHPRHQIRRTRTMQEEFDWPTLVLSTSPETENVTSSSVRSTTKNDVVVQQGDVMKLENDTHFLSHSSGDGMKCTKADHFLSHANRGSLNLDYQEQPSKSNFATDLGSHAYSKEARTLGRVYHGQQPYFSPSSCSWEKSSALKVVPNSPDASGHIVGEMRTKTNILSARSNYLSYPTDVPHIRYRDEVKVDLSQDDNSKQYRRPDQFTAFSNFNGQSSEHLETAKGANYMDEITPISRQWCFDNRGPSLPRGLDYGDEIPSLSSKKCNGNVASSYSRIWDYSAETSSVRQCYGDKIPSLSHHWHYRDKIPLHSGQWCHDAEARPLSNYQQGASYGNGRLRDNISRGGRNEQVNIISTRRTMTKPRVANKVVSSTDHYKINKDNLWRNSEDIRDQVRGPRANKLNNSSTSSIKNNAIPPLVCRDQINRPEFTVQYEHAKFFMIKSYSEDDVHKGIKYNVWASTPNGNNKLDAAFHEAQILMKEQGKRCPIFLFFSVNTSGQFVGLAEMLGPVDFKKTMDFWQQDKWNGFFPVMWHIIKDIPNRFFKHITLENNEGKVVTFSRDTQEIGLPQGLEMLKIFKAYHQGTSILDDFYFYEEKENMRHAQKGRNLETTNQDLFSDDFRSISVNHV
uniref:YTH domain-containing family protein n=1 Tax=Oryza barthii TaxID=65489 RepID=A0A0D3G2B1_9ORYZ